MTKSRRDYSKSWETYSYPTPTPPVVPRWLAVAGGIVAVVAACGALWYLLVLVCWDIADVLLRAVGR